MTANFATGSPSGGLWTLEGSVAFALVERHLRGWTHPTLEKDVAFPHSVIMTRLRRSLVPAIGTALPLSAQPGFSRGESTATRAQHLLHPIACRAIPSASATAPTPRTEVLALWAGAYALVFAVLITALGFRLRTMRTGPTAPTH